MNPWWQQVWMTLCAEFSDFPDAAQVTRIILRLLLSAILGGILGYEREQQGKSAGLRTHMLVALGAALFVLIPQQAGVSDADM
jgi:putative Mg2+ transporter-C (MgtC) family protein